MSGVRALAVAVDAADALLELVGVERDVVVDQPVAVVLQVDALAGGVGGEQDAHRVLGRVGLEGQPQLLPLLGGDTAVQQRQPLAGEPLLPQQLGQPELGVAVLGEDDDALVGPVLAVGRADGLRGSRCSSLALASGWRLVGDAPSAPSARSRAISSSVASGCIGRVRLRASSSASASCSSSRVATSSKNSSIHSGTSSSAGTAAGALRRAQCLQVDGDGVGERGRAGEQPLLQQQRHQVGGLAAPLRLSRLRRSVGELLEQRVDLALGLRVVDRHRRCVGVREARCAVGVDDVPLEPAYDGVLDRGLVRVDAAGEPLVVDDLQQRGERRLVAVVRGGRQEEPVREVRGEPADQLGLLRVDRVHLLGRGRGDVVRLVEDEQVEGARVGRAVGGQHLVEQPLGLRPAQPGQADDAQRVDPERVGGGAVGAAHESRSVRSRRR